MNYNNNNNEIKIPEQFICPISLEIMSVPVICEDGHTYDRSSISKISNPKSPITRQPINLNKLIPNIALRQLIEKFAEQNNIKLEKISRVIEEPIEEPIEQTNIQENSIDDITIDYINIVPDPFPDPFPYHIRFNSHITFPRPFNSDITFPRSFSHITFPRPFNSDITFPRSFSHITFPRPFNQLTLEEEIEEDKSTLENKLEKHSNGIKKLSFYWLIGQTTIIIASKIIEYYN
jgi:hypothetical protein